MTLRAPTILFSTALLSACGQPPDSINSHLYLSLDSKVVAELRIPLRCSYAWAYFSESDMASHYEAKAEPARAPKIFLTLPDQRLLALTPEPWPPIDNSGRCNPAALHGWQALVFDARQPVPLLTISRSVEAGGPLSGLTLIAKTSDVTAPSSHVMTAPLAIRQAVTKSSSLDFAVLDAHGSGDTALSNTVSSALSSLPTDRPSILLPAIRTHAPLNPDAFSKEGALAGLPDFDLAKAMSANTFSTYPSMPGLPITIDPNRPRDEGRVYFPSDVPTPSVTLPGLETPLPIAPVAAVWYPDFKKLIVISWTQRSGELAKLIE